MAVFWKNVCGRDVRKAPKFVYQSYRSSSRHLFASLYAANGSFTESRSCKRLRTRFMGSSSTGGRSLLTSSSSWHFNDWKTITKNAIDNRCCMRVVDMTGIVKLRFKVHSHLMCAFAFFFDICHLENANDKCEYHHLLPKNPFLNFDINVNAEVTCEQGFKRPFMPTDANDKDQMGC